MLLACAGRSASSHRKRGAAILIYDDHSALRACFERGSGLCTIVGIEGSFSRRLGAQLAVSPDGAITGSLADGCLEHQLVQEMQDARREGRPRLLRFGKGSPLVDFRLPCGAGLDVLVDPAPEMSRIRSVIEALDARKPATLALPLPATTKHDLVRDRSYTPLMRIMLFGEGPELESISALAAVGAIEIEEFKKRGAAGGNLSLGRVPQNLSADRWTAILLLFHDHEWEIAILQWALSTPAFFIGAQGGAQARGSRVATLSARGIQAADISRIRSPIGLIPHAREPFVLAVSALAEIVAEYERLVPRDAQHRRW